MAGHRARRAMRPSLVTRVTRIAVPSLVVAAGAFGIVLAAQPQQSVQATPAPLAVVSPTAAPPVSSANATSVLDDLRAQRANRGQAARPSLSVTKTKSTKSTTTKSTNAKSAKPKGEPAPELTVTGSRYTTVDLNLRLEATETSKVEGVLETGVEVKVTATVRDGFRYIAYAGKGRWVKNQYLSTTKPDPATTGGISKAACKTGSKVESGLTADAIAVHRAICARYPQVTAFGGRRNSNDFHGSGRAVDSMISNSTVGWEIARWVRAHARELGVSEVIYSQKIWTVQRSSEGWRSMPDRGSRTANHYDHVHVSVYGNRATG